MIIYASHLVKFVLISLFLTTVTLASPKYIQISNQKQTEHDQIVIYEFFWYGCPHCFNLEPTMNQIEADLGKDTILAVSYTHLTLPTS